MKIASQEDIRRIKQEQYQRAKEQLARLKLLDFGQFIDPDFEKARHLEFIQSKLGQVQRYLETGGKEGIGRLIISMPPRHGKSNLVTTKWPMFLLGLHPDLRIILVAHTQDLANDFSRIIRDTLLHNEEYSLLFPHTIVDKSSAATERWQILGQTNPALIAAGVGGPVVGRGGDLIILDDIIKSRAEANSPTFRKHNREYYTGTLRTRLQPGGAIVLVMTRWHEEDLIGNLIAQQEMGGEKWDVLNLPAIAEEDGDELGRMKGEALWPEHWPVETLMEVKRGITMGEGGLYEWESQFMGHPKPIAGSKIDISKFQYIDDLPIGLRCKRYWDLALSTKEYASFTASAKGAVDKEGNFYIQEITRDKAEWSVVEDKMKKVFKRETAVEQGVEKKLHGLAVVGQFMRDAKLAFNHFKAIDVDTSKLDRALPWISRLDAGKVYLVKGPWVTDFIEECRNFTGLDDTWSDQVESVSGVYLMLANPKWKKIKFKHI